MWDDEDNNPYGSFARRDSNSSNPMHPGSPGGFAQPPTPPSEGSSPRHDSPEFVPHPQENLSEVGMDDDEDEEEEQGPRKRAGYASRIEQILCENPDLQILITHAGKNHETGGSFIAYTIRTGDIEVRRRYSEFASLRQTLVNLHPTLIVPPIPEKHSMADYAAKPTKAKEDEGIISLRKRMLAVFLNRCRQMPEILDDGVWWKFLDPNASWNEILHAPPVTNIPKNVLKAPPFDTSNPSQAHSYLPVPATNAKLKSGGSVSSSGTPTSPPPQASFPSIAAHSSTGPQAFGRFPPSSTLLSEEELDPYFTSFEASSKELEKLLQGSMEKVNRRLLSHLQQWADDMAEMGARYNAFSLSEQSQTLAAAIEKMGQAVDSTYLATTEMSSNLSATFTEPMRESAQFAGVVGNVLRYRILKRIQEEMTKDELDKKRTLLHNLETSEAEAKRLTEHLGNSGFTQSPPRRSTSAASRRSSEEQRRRDEETASIDSDFPPNQGDSHPPPSASQGIPEPVTPPNHRKSPSGNFITNKIFGSIRHSIQGFTDTDPERNRRDQIGKTRESLSQLEQAQQVVGKDVKDASSGVLRDLKRFQHDKEDDYRRYMISFAKCHIEWAKKNQASWEEAKGEVNNIEFQPPSS